MALVTVAFWLVFSPFPSHSRKAVQGHNAEFRKQPDVISMVLTGPRPRKNFCWQAEARCASKTPSLKLPRESFKVVLHNVYRRKAARRLRRCSSMTKIRRSVDSSLLLASSRATRGSRRVGTAAACAVLVWSSALRKCYYKISAHGCSLASRNKSVETSSTRSAPGHRLFELAAALCCSCSSWSLTTDNLALLPASSTAATFRSWFHGPHVLTP